MTKATAKQLTEPPVELEEDDFLKPTVYLSVTEEQVKDLNVGDKVRVNVTGTVREVSFSKRGKSKVGKLDIDVTTTEVSGGSNEFSEMAASDLE